MRADPFVLLRRLTNTDKFDLESDLKVLQIPDPKLITKKIGYIAEGVREIFDLRPFSDAGLSELECVQLLLTFSAFLDDVKKNGAPNPIMSQVMGNNPMESGTGAASDMKENLVSTSTVQE